MDAKEKAFQLFVKFSELIPSEGADSYEELRSNEANDNEAAKQCALVCVEEIVSGLTEDERCLGLFPFVFWTGVKTELEKL